GDRVGADHLDRDGTVEHGVVAAPHLSHSASTDGADEFVPVGNPLGCRVHGRPSASGATRRPPGQAARLLRPRRASLRGRTERSGGPWSPLGHPTTGPGPAMSLGCTGSEESSRRKPSQNTIWNPNDPESV